MNRCKKIIGICATVVVVIILISACELWLRSYMASDLCSINSVERGQDGMYEIRIWMATSTEGSFYITYLHNRLTNAPADLRRVSYSWTVERPQIAPRFSLAPPTTANKLGFDMDTFFLEFHGNTDFTFSRHFLMPIWPVAMVSGILSGFFLRMLQRKRRLSHIGFEVNDPKRSAAEQ